ncbi:DNA-binding MurR/RpiR family transcriptional regulator [Psychromicrobium silvestre]|uniref:DNA-binding MurR/RpiR family transcriptional regulator n=1 Tax=Psychromicrobium silvestre TaxID=1645614 RepID=A0A7Y9LVN0_9MICC|nr:MurR/RpiR family transcriptional regulator [Psychromicrobium silvestre]NYE96416.1 DNA-binding MurR/RpiR family transcriptional regulator [Psychromicrobium silvestre]
MSIQSTILTAKSSFSPSMTRVAEAVLTNPRLVLEKTITELAQYCQTSETTVVRFCRGIGLAGYVQLRFELATEIGREAAQFSAGVGHGADLNSGNTLVDTVARIAFAEVMSIEETVGKLDVEALAKVIDAVDQARSILLFGVGASNLGSQDLRRKLLRIGRMALEFTDAHDAISSAALIGPQDVAIGFSYSGNTYETVEFLKLAKASGATTVGITNSGNSKLATIADHVLLTSARETTFRAGAMASRIAQLAMVDFIFTGLAERNYDSSVAALKATFDSVEPLKKTR